MMETTQDEAREVSGRKPKFFNVVIGATFGAIGGFFLGGPAGAVAGAFNGASMAIVKEGAQGLGEITHPDLFNTK